MGRSLATSGSVKAQVRSWNIQKGITRWEQNSVPVQLFVRNFTKSTIVIKYKEAAAKGCSDKIILPFLDSQVTK